MRKVPKFFSFFLSLFFSGLGLLFFLLPFSGHLYSLFFSHLFLFPLLGLGMMVLGVFFLLAIFSNTFQGALTVKVSSYEVSLSLIQECLERFCEKKYPHQMMKVSIFPQRKQRIEVVIHMKLGQPLEEKDPFVQEIKKGIKKFLAEQFDYHRTFFLTLFPSKG